MRERLTLRERVLFGIMATGITLSVFAPSCDPQPRSSTVTVEERGEQP